MMRPNYVNNADYELSVRLLRYSVVGPILMAASTTGLRKVAILTEDDLPNYTERFADDSSAYIADQAISEMKQYFDGRLKSFTVPVDLAAATEFQKKVLLKTKAILFGNVLTYGVVAELIGQPQAARAVGGALGRNPISIIIPCHRVVAHGGYLHGYSSPHGILTKAKLLEHEGVRIVNNVVKKFAGQNS